MKVPQIQPQTADDQLFINQIKGKVMSQKIKISEEEVKSVRELQAKFQEVRFNFGGLYLEKLAVDSAVKALTEREGQLQDAWKDLQKQENELLDTILKKYGEGSLDVKEGFFIPESPAVKTS